MKKPFVLLFIVVTFFTANAQVNQKTSTPYQEKEETIDPDNLASQYFSQIMGVAISATSNTKMYKFIYDWIGTPYRLGGSSKKGIDCSKFAFKLYDKAFSTIIGSNSRNIFSMVNQVSKAELEQGDLVFFKIHSKAISHVGIYIGNNKFAHASSSKGVMISNLEDPYWTRYFYKGGRMLETFKEEINFKE